MVGFGIGLTAVVCLLGGGSASAATEAGLLGQWRFDEGAGQVAVDDGPHRLAGRLGSSGDGVDGADPERIAGASGGALHFEGGDFVALPDSPAFAVQSLTAEAVVRAGGSPGAWRYLVSRGGTGCIAGSYGLYTGAAGGVALYVFDGTRYVVSATARPEDVWDGAWHHVAGTFDGRALRLFVDGRLVGEPMQAPLRIDYATASMHASFGQYAGDCELSFTGDLDLVRLWSVARSPGEIGGAAPGGGGPAPGFLSPAAAGSFIPRPSPGGSGASRRRCVVRVLGASARSTGATRVRVRVTRRTRPLRSARVVVRPVGRERVLASARTNRSGRAVLALRRLRPRHVRIGVHGHARCKPVRMALPAPTRR